MKKIILCALLLCTFILLYPLSIYANDTALYTKEDLLITGTVAGDKASLTKFDISGLDDKNEIKTFESKKVFSGVADSGAVITATVYVPAGDGNWKESKVYSATVGASGVFNLNVDLPLGNSIIIIKAEKDNLISAKVISADRKDAEIRDKLKDQLPRNWFNKI